MRKGGRERRREGGREGEREEDTEGGKAVAPQMEFKSRTIAGLGREFGTSMLTQS